MIVYGVFRVAAEGEELLKVLEGLNGLKRHGTLVLFDGDDFSAEAKLVDAVIYVLEELKDELDLIYELKEGRA